MVKNLKRVYEDDFSDAEHLQKVFDGLELVKKILHQHKDLFKSEYYSPWDLNLRQGIRVLETLERKSSFITKLCESLKRKSEPLQTFDGTTYQDEEKKTEHQISVTI